MLKNEKNYTGYTIKIIIHRYRVVTIFYKQKNKRLWLLKKVKANASTILAMAF